MDQGAYILAKMVLPSAPLVSEAQTEGAAEPLIQDEVTFRNYDPFHGGSDCIGRGGRSGKRMTWEVFISRVPENRTRDNCENENFEREVSGMETIWKFVSRGDREANWEVITVELEKRVFEVHPAVFHRGQDAVYNGSVHLVGGSDPNEGRLHQKVKSGGGTALEKPIDLTTI